MYFDRYGLMFVLSSPSGAGKTTLVKKLLQNEPNIVPSISVTTRPKRTGEVEGKDYFFIAQDDYQQKIDQKELLEHATVHQNGYGTPKEFVEKTLLAGKDIIFDLDWQGAEQLRQHGYSNLVTLFIFPPSSHELRHRLEGRGTDAKDIIEKRLDKSKWEMSHWESYDYVLINDNPETCYHDVRSIYHAEALKRQRQKNIPSFVSKF